MNRISRRPGVRSGAGPNILAAAALFVLVLALAGPAPMAGQEPPAPDTAWLIASAVLAAPAPLRAGAEVRGWTADGELVTLRPGTNGIICLADRPDTDGFAVACYHADLEPFMARGRELTRQGIQGARRDQVRWQEIEAGSLPMPAVAMVYNLRFPSKDFDPATTDPATGSRLHALYIPGATTESTGVSARPSDEPWLMLPGTPSAHVMISLPRKQP
jgi:hypothetical protein